LLLGFIIKVKPQLLGDNRLALRIFSGINYNLEERISLG